MQTASIAERVNLTFKRMMLRCFTKNRTYRYIDVLPNVVASYNATPYRSLNNTVPRDVNEFNKYDLSAYMYIIPLHKEKSEKDERIKESTAKGKQTVRF